MTITRQPHFKIYRDKKRQWRWRLRAANGKIIADCAESYKTSRSCRGGIDLVLNAAHDAYIEVRE